MCKLDSGHLISKPEGETHPADGNQRGPPGISSDRCEVAQGLSDDSAGASFQAPGGSNGAYMCWAIK